MGWVRTHMERYRGSVEELRQVDLVGMDDPHLGPLLVLSAWGMRYQARRQAIEGLRAVDPDLQRALEARHRAADAAVVGEPRWDPELRLHTHGSAATRFTGIDHDEPHPHGPSLRRLWLGAERAGADRDGALEVIRAWAEAPLPALAEEVPATWLRRRLAWRPGTSADRPWVSTWDGRSLELGLEDYPERQPWNLWVDGAAQGALCDWPEGWVRGEPPPEPVVPVRPRWLERYRAGERVEVWEELRAAGAHADGGALRADALAVARETARRLRHDLELLLPRLVARGYRFRTIPLVPPDTALEATIERLRSRGLILPLALESFLLEVGAVDLTGEHPVLSPGGTRDPLVLAPWANDWTEALEELEEGWDGGRVELVLAHDAEDKAALVRGEDFFWEPGLWVYLPARGADATLGGSQGDTLVEHLRRAMAHGGLLGWAGRGPPQGLADLIRGFTGF